MNFQKEDEEEGEVKIYDKDQYLVTNGELFEFHTQSNVTIDWRQIREFDQLDDPMMAEKHILQNLNTISECDYNSDKNGKWLSLEGKQVL